MKSFPLLSAMVLLLGQRLGGGAAKDPIGAEPVWDEPKDSSEAPYKDKVKDKARDKANPKPKDKAKDEPKEQSAQNIIDPFLWHGWSGSGASALPRTVLHRPRLLKVPRLCACVEKCSRGGCFSWSQPHYDNQMSLAPGRTWKAMVAIWPATLHD